ncbi:hypothetical protein ACFL1V_03535 [Pseudomonadota bacterium]
MFKKLQFTIPIMVALITLPFMSVSAGGPPKITEILPQPFQIILSAIWEGGNLNSLTTISDPFVIEEEKTALLQYVSCRATHANFNGSNDATFRLTAEVEGAFPGEVTILAGEMVPETAFHGGPTYEASADVISACIGMKCNSLGDDTYMSLKLYAARNSGSDTPESVDCLISGLIY